MKSIARFIVSLSLAIALGYPVSEPVNASSHRKEPVDSSEQRASMQAQKPIVLLVPGFSTVEILTRGWKRNRQKHTCSEKPIPIRDYKNGYFEELPEWLLEAGFDVRVAMLETNYERTPGIPENAECLRKQIILAAQESPIHEVAIIAHSMGGLVTRAYVQSEKLLADRALYGIPLVRKVFLAGVPNHGTPLHFWLNLLLDCESPETKQKAACEFTSDEWMQAFNATYHATPTDVDIYAIGGTFFKGRLGYLLGSFLCLIAGPNDGAIPVNSALGVEGAAARLVFNASHQISVGAPSYFSGINGEKNQFFTDCLYPVLVMGDRNGCKSTGKPSCAPALPILILLAGAVLLLSEIILRKQRRPKLKTGPSHPGRE